MLVAVEGNRAHPITQGVICQRLRIFAKNVASEHRLRTPLERTGERGSGSFRETTWSEALSEIAERILAAAREHGSSTVGLYDTGGNAGVLARNFPLRLINSMNGSVTDDTICSAAGSAALRYNFGSEYGYPAERIPEARLIVLWGINSRWTNIHGAMLVQKAKKRGASVWVIDPIRTVTAEMGRHLQIKPGTDAALALTIINHIVENRMHDEEFIGKNMVGFDNLVEIARKYDIRRAAQITGLKSRDISELATEFVSLRPCVICIGYGLQRQRNGGELVRAISIIPSVVGQHRGFLYSNDVLDFDTDYLTGAHMRTQRSSRFNPLELPKLIRDGKLRVLIVINSNPLATLPNQNALRAALRESDIFVVTHDLFMTDTADFSDIVLPATSMFEQFDIVSSYFHDYLNLNEAAIPPVGDSKSNVDLFKALARQLGLSQADLFENEEALVSNLLRSSRRIEADLVALRKRGFVKLSPLSLDRYQTPSGKIEALSTRAREDGLPTLPDHVPIIGTEPFQLITPSTVEMNHSSYHLLAPSVSPRVLINPIDASALGVKDGDVVTLASEYGTIRLPAEFSDRVLPGVLVSHAGLWPKLSGGININFLTTDYIQRFGGNSAYHSTFVRIVR